MEYSFEREEEDDALIHFFSEKYWKLLRNRCRVAPREAKPSLFRHSLFTSRAFKFSAPLLAININPVGNTIRLSAKRQNGRSYADRLLRSLNQFQTVHVVIIAGMHVLAAFHEAKKSRSIFFRHPYLLFLSLSFSPFSPVLWKRTHT